MSKNKKMFIGAGVIAAAILFILIGASTGSAGVEIEIKEILDNQQDYPNKYGTTEGLVMAETIEWDAQNLELTFMVEDEQDGSQLKVRYNGVKPDNFTDEIICIIEGAPSETEAGLFIAESVKTKCPSKYEGKEDQYDANMHEQMNGTYDPETHTFTPAEGSEETKN